MIILLSITTARTSACIFLSLQTTGELGVAFGVGGGVVGVAFCVGEIGRGGVAGVAWGWTGGGAVVEGVDGFGGFVPGGFFGVDVYVEPGLLVHIDKVLGRMEYEPFFIFGVPYCFVSCRNFRRWRTGRRGKFIHFECEVSYEFVVVRSLGILEKKMGWFYRRI